MVMNPMVESKKKNLHQIQVAVSQKTSHKLDPKGDLHMIIAPHDQSIQGWSWRQQKHRHFSVDFPYCTPWTLWVFNGILRVTFCKQNKLKKRRNSIVEPIKFWRLHKWSYDPWWDSHTGYSIVPHYASMGVAHWPCSCHSKSTSSPWILWDTETTKNTISTNLGE